MKKIYTIILISWLISFGSISMGSTFEWLPSSIDFRETSVDTPNPDRGMFNQIRVDNSLRVGPLASDIKNHRIYFVLDRFIDQLIPEEELKNLDQSLDLLAHAGQRGVIRFIYDWPSDELVNSGLTLRRARTASLPMMMEHIRQLAGVLRRHPQAVFAVESGLIGFWGEQHGDTPDKQTPSGVMAIVDQWRAELMGTNILVLARYPKALREQVRVKPELLRQNPMLGFWNDCLGAKDDENMNSIEVAVVVGETCILPPRSDYSCATMSSYFKAIHLNLLHAHYYRPTIEQWAAEGCLEEVRRNLGYRYVIREAKLASDNSKLELRIDNVGWGQSLVSRPLYLVSNGRRVQKIADLESFLPGSINRIHADLDASKDWAAATLSLETEDQVQFSNTTANLLYLPPSVH